ncbi:MAG TPA: TetR/AcrR family transcriptional regulator [Terriglobia bacterium]
MTRSPQPGRSRRPRRGARAVRGSKAFDRKLDAILRHSAAVFCSRGYHQASIRDIARLTGVSLAGLYYYFSSKEELLYLIQRHTFETILTTAKAAIEGIEDPEQRLRVLIGFHVQFFLHHPNEMKVLIHEEEWLGKGRSQEVRAIKRAYYQLVLDQVEALRGAQRLERPDSRLAVLSLFGMMNWIYTWYNPKIDPDAPGCAEVMAAIFLRGILGESVAKSTRRAAGVAANGQGPKAGRRRARGQRPSNGESSSIERPAAVERLNARPSQAHN